MWYIIDGYVDHQERLAQKKLNVVTMDIEHPVRLSGIAFPEEEAETILTELGLNRTFEKMETEMPGLTFLSFGTTRGRSSSPEEFSVNICTWKGDPEYKSYVKKLIAQKLLPVVRKNVEVYAPHGSKTKPEDDGVFRIFLFSSSPDEGDETATTPPTIFGVSVEGCSQACFVPSGKSKDSILIIDEETFHVVAQIIGNNLYIHHDICHFRSGHDYEILKEIINRTARELTSSPEDRLARQQKLEAEKAKGRVIVERWSVGEASKKRFVNAVREVLLPGIKKDTVIYDMRQNKAKPVNDGRFHIFIWSTVAGDESLPFVRPPEKLFGLQVDCRAEAFQPSGNREDSVIIKDDKSEYVIAELFESNLFIHHYICYDEEPREAELFKRLLKVVVEELSVPPEQRIERKRQQLLEKQKREAEEAERERIELQESTKKARPLYIEACAKRFPTIIAETVKTIEEVDGRMKKLGAAIIAAAKNTDIIEFSIGHMKLKLENEKAALAEEFDKILALPDVVGAFVEKDTLVVFTDVIRISHEGRTYVIGQFRIEICVSAKCYNITFKNITNWGCGPGLILPKGFDADSRLNRHHPYADAEGKVDLGKLDAELPQFLSKNKYFAVVMLVIQFLKTVNVADYAGKGLKWWPCETEEALSATAEVPAIKRRRVRRKKKLAA